MEFLWEDEIHGIIDIFGEMSAKTLKSITRYWNLGSKEALLLVLFEI